jgi:hypothetical protein
MVVRRTADGKALTTGAQVGIEKGMYLSLCRRHWVEETGSERKPAKAARTTKPAAKKKRPVAKTSLRLAAANAGRPPKRTKR